MISNFFAPIIISFLGVIILYVEYDYKTISTLRINDANLKKFFIINL